MRLLDVQVVLDRERNSQGRPLTTTVFVELDDSSTNYAILSHCWGEEEVNFDQMTQLMRMAEPDLNKLRQHAGYKKIVKSCEQAEKDGYTWMWIDTCCIDKRNTSELSEAINSMYRWYQNAQECYAYFNDLEESIFPTQNDFSKFGNANGLPEWFSRGWTLQELIAPKQVEFFNRDWVSIGDKQLLANTLENITRIPPDVLKDGRIPKRLCIAELMSWAADRKTTLVEDRAYSLLGLFGVHMPIMYGEGEKAFQRLQVEILRVYGDHSIFAWNPKGQFRQVGSTLASSPSHFRGCHDVEKVEVDQLVDEIIKSHQSGFDIPRRISSRLPCLKSRRHALRARLAIFRDTNSRIGLQRLLWKPDHYRLEIFWA
ncbi:heterokaryon incompatibility protein-domain-containing protein [Pisolithus marmoratus]|nr:heterokaryon incompatibility protein-domain-containing protein [Pisolithus marmoratus]